MNKVFVADLKERDVVDSPFLVRDKIMAMAKNGKPYMTLKLMDRSGEVEGRVWDRVDEFDQLFNKDDFVCVRAKASVYLGKMQLIVQDIQLMAEESVDLGDFLPVSQYDPQQMLDEARSLIAAMSDTYLQQLLNSFFNDPQFTRLYSKAPAAKAMHHVYLGGLLEHSLSVARLAVDVCKRYAKIDRDLLISGALLHDIGKVAELQYERSFDYSDEGKLLGHIVIGVEMVDDKIRTIDGFPRLKATLIKHLLLSHHGQYDYGSPKRPKTLEAVVLNFLDDMDSKINGVQAHIEKDQKGDSGWTGYHRLYDRYFFIGEQKEQSPEVGIQPQPAAVAQSIASAPVSAPASAPIAAAIPQEPAASEPPAVKKPRSRSRSNSPLSSNLGEQLSGLNLDLFGNKEE